MQRVGGDKICFFQHFILFQMDSRVNTIQRDRGFLLHADAELGYLLISVCAWKMQGATVSCMDFAKICAICRDI